MAIDIPTSKTLQVTEKDKSGCYWWYLLLTHCQTITKLQLRTILRRIWLLHLYVFHSANIIMRKYLMLWVYDAYRYDKWLHVCVVLSAGSSSINLILRSSKKCDYYLLYTFVLDWKKHIKLTSWNLYTNVSIVKLSTTGVVMQTQYSCE